MAGPDERALRANPRAAPTGHEAELGRLRSDATFHQRFRELTVAFSRGLSSTAALAAALKTLVLDANALLGASRTSVWLHERRSYELVLAACSDDHPPALAGTVRSDDATAPPAMGLRLDHPAIVPGGAGSLLLAPLRGRRRALGTLVVESPFTGALEGARLVDFAQELSRQLSAAIDNIQLLEGIIGQRRLLEDMFDALVDLVVVTDAALRIVQMNDAFLCRVGRTRSELLERPIGEVIGPEMTAWIRTASDTRPGTRVAERASTARFEDPRLAGIFAVTMTALAQEGSVPAGHVIVARDITHQTRLEQDRDAMRERLAQSEKLAALGQFVAGIAHEMNNPLQGVLGHLELMLETSPAAQPLRHELRRVLQDADRAAKIVRNLMVFTGARRMTRRRLAPSRLLSRALASRAAALAQAGIDVTCEEAAGLPPVIGDPLLLHQALLNILINAEHAIASSGGGGHIHVRVSAPDGRVVMAIRDTGPGIPADVLSRIFDPFFTTKEVGHGTGLGLAITYGIVQEHGGIITAANHPGGGAVLTIDLPAAGPRPDSGRTP